MASGASRKLRLLGVLAGLVLAGCAGAGTWFTLRLRGSLPVLDGTVRLSGLSADVTVSRDSLGVPTVAAKTRADVARALGFLHAQDRFFQMDLSRRSAAGELSELFGRAALGADTEARRNGFRALSRTVVARARPELRRIVEAYAQGVNAGLAALRDKPFEYLVLRAEPKPWLPEDCALVAFAMTRRLQSDDGRYERTLTDLRDAYGLQAVNFFAPLLTPEDAALDGSVGRPAPLPPPKLIDLRLPAAESGTEAKDREPFPIPGSNSMAVAGRATSTGSALIASDMHLDLAVPNFWYRASLSWDAHTVTGITLPGLPLVIAGSNGRVAWGFTASPTDTGDLVMVTPADLPGYYRAPAPADSLPYEKRRETIRVKGAEPVTVTYDWTVWGPIVGKDTLGHPLAFHWLPHDPAAINFELVGMEDAATVDQAVAVAHRSGTPSLNILVGDSAGRIAWTISGFLQRRKGYDGRFPVSWLYGDRGWEGVLPGDQVPVVTDPSGGILWTANNRILGGGALTLLGDGGYDRPARAAQLRDDLAALVARREPVRPADLLAIQLDDRALFLSRWQRFLMEALSPEVVGRDADRAELRSLAARWDNRASADSVSYRLVREFRLAVARRVLDPIFEPCAEADPGFRASLLKTDDALWTIVHERPAHLLGPGYSGWDGLFAAAADDVVRTVRSKGTDLSSATWGKLNRLRIVHPFSRVLPAWLTGWLSMPSEAASGDSDMPKVMGPAFGATERFVVSPGHEAEGIFEMACGESGHPLSPFFRAGHEAWVRGEPAPFLPGAAVHTLLLKAQDTDLFR